MGCSVGQGQRLAGGCVSGRRASGGGGGASAVGAGGALRPRLSSLTGGTRSYNTRTGVAGSVRRHWRSASARCWRRAGALLQQHDQHACPPQQVQGGQCAPRPHSDRKAALSIGRGDAHDCRVVHREHGKRAIGLLGASCRISTRAAVHGAGGASRARLFLAHRCLINCRKRSGVQPLATCGCSNLERDACCSGGPIGPQPDSADR